MPESGAIFKKFKFPSTLTISLSPVLPLDNTCVALRSHGTRPGVVSMLQSSLAIYPPLIPCMSNVYIVYIIYLLIYLSIYLTIYLLPRSAGWRPRAGLRAVRPAAADRQMQLQHSLLHLGYRGEYSTVQYSTEEYSTVQYSIVQWSQSSLWQQGDLGYNWPDIRQTVDGVFFGLHLKY